MKFLPTPLLKPDSSRLWRIVRTAALVVVLAVTGVAAAWVASLLPKKTATPSSAPAAETGKADRFRRVGRDEISGPAEAAERLGVKTAIAIKPVKPLALPPFQGNLALDNDRQARVRSRFAGDVVLLSKVEDPAAVPSHRPLRDGDVVHAQQLLAVVWSKDLGEKKSELVDAVSKLRTDEETMKRLKDLGNGTSERSVREAERNVESDRVAVERAVRTLRSWRLTEEEIEAVRADADRIRSGKPGKSDDWAKVEVRAPCDGVILEKNTWEGAIVDTTVDLFLIGDLTNLAVWAHVYEEDLQLFKGLPRPIPWTVTLPSQPGVKFEGTLERIGAVIDPNQHTALVRGTVANLDGELKVGQSVTVTVQVPPKKGEVAVPADAVVEDGRDSIVFVQPDSKETRYVRTAVAITRRFRDTIYLKLAPGSVKPGDLVVTAGSLLLRDALEELPLPAEGKAGER